MITYFVICILHKNSWVIVELYHIPYVGCKNINDYPGPGIVRLKLNDLAVADRI